MFHNENRIAGLLTQIRERVDRYRLQLTQLAQLEVHFNDFP